MTHFPLATIAATEVRTLQSVAVGQDYPISVALPFHYAERRDETYPVIYVLDGNLYFGMVVEMVRTLTIRVLFCDESPDVIIVGIGYPMRGSPAENHARVMHLRMRDFLSVRDEGAEGFIQDVFPVQDRIESGSAHRFLEFIQHELTPWINVNYRVNPTDNTLLGFSWGGEFALTALFHQPDLFQRYVVVSPDLPHGNGAVLDYEQAYAQDHADLPVRLYLAYGEPEVNDYERPFLERFLAALHSRPYAGFTLTYQLIPNCTHCAVVAPAFLAGLMAVFP